MNTKSICPAALLVISAMLAAEPTKPLEIIGWKFLGLKGEVKTLKTVDYDVTVDKKGKISSETERFTTIRTFDRKGRQVEYLSKSASGVVDAKVTYVFDDRGNNTEQYSYRKGSLSLKVILEYDAGGNLVASTGYKPDGSASSKTTFVWTVKEGNFTRTAFDAKGKSSVKSDTSVFDSHGNTSESESYERDTGAIMVKNKFEYVYDTNGTMLSKKFLLADPSGAFVQKWEQTYDKNGELQWLRFYTDQGALKSVSGFERTYDKKGNYVKEASYDLEKKNGKEAKKITNIAKREITYY